MVRSPPTSCGSALAGRVSSNEISSGAGPLTWLVGCSRQSPKPKSTIIGPVTSAAAPTRAVVVRSIHGSGSACAKSSDW